MGISNAMPGLVTSNPNAGGAGASLFPPAYVYGLQLSWVDDSTVLVAPGGARAELLETNLMQVVPFPVRWNDGPGLGGRDTLAGLDANIITYIYIIAGAGKVTGPIISASPTAPELPAGYTSFRFIGSVPLGGLGGIPKFNRFTQSGTDRSRRLLIEAPDASATLGGGSWPSAMGQIPGVSGSTSWRNIVSGGTDVVQSMAQQVPARPAGSGAPGSPRGILVDLAVIFRTQTNDFIEFAAADGSLEVPDSSPVDGRGFLRLYPTASNQIQAIQIQVGELQSIQYRCTVATLNYMLGVAGWTDEL